MKKLLLILTFLISTILVIDNVSAESLFDNIGDKYYIVHKWVGNSNNTGNDAYYVGIYNNYPIIENETISDTENIIYYKILTKYNLFQFLNTGDVSYVDTITTTKNSMMLNSDSSHMLYANFDLYSNGKLYFAKKDYAPLSAPSDVQNYYNVTSFYDSDINSYKDENYYILKSSLDSMLYDDINEWASTSNNYSSTSLNTIKNNLLNGKYDTYIENYGPYYITYNANAYNTNKICFFRNYDDIYLKRTHSDNGYNFKINLKNSYCISYDRSSSTDLFSFNGELQPFTYMTTDVFNNIISLSGQIDTIYYSDDDILKGLLGNELITTPLIDITKENENKVEIDGIQYIKDVTLNIEFSNIDNEKYFYLYKYGKDSEWSQLVLSQSNSISKTFSTNDTLYVQIIDSSTHEYIIGATYLIDNINYDGKPYITFGLIDSENENICITESGKHICENLIIDSHITNFEQYSFYVFNNTTNESKRSFESKINYFVYENSTIEARIVDNYTNEIIDKKFYNIKSISLDSSMGQHITNDCYFAQFGTNYLCNFYFYNYDANNYKYYIGTNTTNFIELLNNNSGLWLNNKLIDFHLVQDNLAKLHEYSISENTTFYFKIVDKSTDEIIYTKTFTIPYNKKLEESEKTNLFDIFKKYINENENFKNIINQIWTSISSSAIYEYILILIIGTLIILIIKASNR